MVKSSLLNGIFCLHLNRFSVGCLTLNISQRSNCDIIVISLQIDLSFSRGEPPSAYNLTPIRTWYQPFPIVKAMHYQRTVHGIFHIREMQHVTMF